MKKVFVFSFLLLGSLYFSQSVVEKYNTIYNRYEYFDSQGNMIGYKGYNNLTRQWEYYDTKATQKQPYQYREPAKVDLNSTFNAASTLQNRYDNNTQLVQNTINIIDSKINNLDISENDKNIIHNSFSKAISKNLNGQNFNYSSSSETNRIINWLYDTINTITENTINSSKRTSNSNESTSDKYLGLYSNKVLELDKKLKSYREDFQNNSSFNSLEKDYQLSRDTFSRLARNLELNSNNSEEIYQKLNDIIRQMSYLSVEKPSKNLTVKRINQYNKDGHILKESNVDSYVYIKDTEIIYKTSNGEKLYRDLSNKKYNSSSLGYEYTSKWGGTFIPDNLSFIKFYSNNDFTGDYYIYYISQ
ncbi:hypothetical protein [Epilithonimonas hungarica]|uniref:Uncharacterized protein n=1 Tax=Epilithonimonas hungarica TaxID=454006 RepID=A0A1G7LN08_9FLAO|nr:hypothetical protein [Epilithonimonas hungarica]SDF50917.1 hypothetical protein SAMN05421825_1551 [Epilithonimonas hungarica]